MPEILPIELIYSLVGYPDETEWIEFKESNSDPERIGRDISALANSAAYLGRAKAYKLWGVADDTHALVGTQFDPYHSKARGNQDLLIWLKTMLSANAGYDFSQFTHEGMRFVVLTVRAADGQPVYFQNVAYLRKGSSTTRVIPGSAREAELWRRLQRGDYEGRVAQEGLDVDEVADLLDIGMYFERLGIRAPSDPEVALDQMREQDLVLRQDNGRWAVTNLGALLVARRLSAFSHLRKRVIRVVQFNGHDRFDLSAKTEFDEGYALAIDHAETYIAQANPAHEVLDGAFRRVINAFPRRAVRELLANMAIHQDLSDTQAGPLVQMFADRIEFGNPGVSLISPDRVLNAQPKTRNGALSGLLRQMDVCEESGSGWDLAVGACEAQHLPAPHLVTSDADGTLATLYAYRPFDEYTRAERLDALYYHACLCYAQVGSMTNASLRKRFGLGDERKNTLAISRLVREGCDAGLVKPEDEHVGRAQRAYVPAWA